MEMQNMNPAYVNHLPGGNTEKKPGVHPFGDCSSFKGFLLVERKDQETINEVSRLVKELYQQIISYYNGLMNIGFPTKKEIDNHEKFMSWRNERNLYKERNIPQYKNRKIIISSHSNFDGEYKPTLIYLYNDNFKKLETEFNDLYHSYEYGLRGNYEINYKLQKIKREAKQIHLQMMNLLNNKKEEFENTLFHEIIHLLDHDRIGKVYNKVSDNISDKFTKNVNNIKRSKDTLEDKNKKLNYIYNQIYSNNNLETNAWFLTGVKKVLQSNFNNFQELLNNFKSFVRWNDLSEDNKKKMTNRLYQIYKGNL